MDQHFYLRPTHRSFYLKRLIYSFLFSIIFFTSWGKESDKTHQQFTKYTADAQVGFIGVDAQHSFDSPFDNIFKVQIPHEVCADEEIWLSYEVKGVDGPNSVSRSINNQIAFGGHFVEESNDWHTVKEQISPQWLKEGDNIVRFATRANGNYGYQVKNVNILVGSGAQEPQQLVINQNSDHYYDDKGYIKGFVSGENATLHISNAQYTVFNGEFEAIVEKPATVQPGEAWSTEVTVRFADGSQLKKLVRFQSTTCVDYQFPIENNTQQAFQDFSCSAEQKLSLEGAHIEVPSGALAEEKILSITTLRSVDMPPLDAGMVNVTANHAGYRFLPHGTLFDMPSKIVLPFDKSKIPDGYTEKDIRTYYFDEKEHQWVPLVLDSAVAAAGQIWSLTTHFTDMINGIIKVPESPEVNAYNSTSMKGIKAANPATGVNLMQAPSANNSGSASMQYPLNIPGGRNGMQPQIALSYNNGGGNGWMGIGWNLSIPAVSVDTRWGVPRYDKDYETETYSLSGQQLAPVAHRGEPKPREADKQFHPRVEGGFNKIIRHGNSPSNYYWEVTDKSGTKYFYGGTSNGFDENAVLNYARNADPANNDSNNIAYWALAEVRDLNGNFVRYHYTKQKDVGLTAGTEQGYALYIQRITYTGHGSSEGPYEVDFIRDRDLGEPRREDVMIDGRYGFKQVTADLLRKVDVKYGDEEIRHYEFEYEYGAFSKSLLKRIKEFDSEGTLFTTHEMQYYDDVQSGNTYVPLKDIPSWDMPDDGLKTNFVANKTGFKSNSTALGGTKGNSWGAGGSVNVGVGANVLCKTNSVGGTFSYSRSKSEGLNALLDINGDGLPDKVYLKGGVMYYRPNLMGTDGKYGFGDKVAVTGINDISFDKSSTFGGGLEVIGGSCGPINVRAGVDLSWTTSKNSIYFSEVNGDQIPDLVKKGVVYFGRISDSGLVFEQSSDKTVNPIYSGASIDDGLIQVDQDEIQNVIDRNPLQDAIRVWVAPFEGDVSISAPIKLGTETDSLEQGLADGDGDGVKAFIQKENEELWNTTIAFDDYTEHNVALNNIHVQKGDRIFFRLNSIYNGFFDHVHWNPEITYTDSNRSAEAMGPNQKYLYKFKANDDYLLTAKQFVEAPIDGQIEIKSLFDKPVLTDTVRVQITKTSSDQQEIIELDSVYSWNKEVQDSLNLSLSVVKGDVLKFKVLSPTNVGWQEIDWKPYVYYSASNDPNTPKVIASDGKPMVTFHPVPDMSLYAVTEQPSKMYQVKTDTNFIEVVPAILWKTQQGLEKFKDSLVFSVKKHDSLLFEKKLSIDSGRLQTQVFQIPTYDGDSIYFEAFGNSDTLKKVIDQVYFKLNNSDDKIPTGLYYAFKKQPIFGPLYRHWGQFGYNSNDGRDSKNIDLSLLKLPDYNSGDLQVDPSKYSDGEELENDPNVKDPSKDVFVLMLPDGDHRKWVGYDQYNYISKDLMSSTRLGEKNPKSVEVGEVGGSSTALGITKITKTFNKSFSAGGGSDFISGSYGKTVGNSTQLLDFIDMNGDRYPDVVSENRMQYTTPLGGLSDKLVVQGGFDGFSKTSLNSDGVTVSGTFVKSEVKPVRPGKHVITVGGGSNSAGLNGNFGKGHNEQLFSYMDMNGDGLPDRVVEGNNGVIKVAINLGYSFSAFEDWGTSKLGRGESKSYGGGLGFSLGAGSITAGVGVSRSENFTTDALQDVNGDGLVDQVMYQKDAPIKVRLNLGSGFSDNPISWTGAEHITESVTVGESANVAFTFGFTILAAKFTVTPNGSIGHSITRELTRFTDIDGDGFPDFLHSEKDGELKVKRSTIGRTNMLKSVTRPLGAKFILSYKRKGNTYKLPNNVWVLSGVKMYDGFSGDGVDTLRTRYEYEDGYYDRHERETYGFHKVVATKWASATATKPYTIVTQTYNNDNYYKKGLLLKQEMTDGEGHIYTVKENTYQLKNPADGSALADDYNTDDGQAFPAMTETRQDFYEGGSSPGKSTHMHYEYDAIGNVVKYQDFGDEGSDDDLTATISYYDYDDPYLKGSPKSIVVSGTKGEYRKREADIDQATGNVTEIRQFLSDDKIAHYNMSYDGYGNLSSIIRPKNAEGKRFSIDYTYDTEVHTFVTEVHNSYGYSSTAKYDYKYGQVLESTDLNGNKISYVLDKLGRVHEITGPYEQKGALYTIQFEYHLPDETSGQSGPAWALTRHYDPQMKNNDLETALFIDGLGRVLQTKKDGAIYQGEGKPDKEQMIVSGRVKFDAFGRSVEAYYPTTEDKGTDQQTGTFNPQYDDVAPTTTAYDVLNRAISVTLPDGSVTQTDYGFGQDRDGKTQFDTQTTDANGVVTHQYKDVKGRVTAVKNRTSDGNVWTSFTYDAMSEQVTATDDLGATTYSTYDKLGRRVKRVHPDAGETDYSYDLAGNMTQMVTANLAKEGSAIKYQYDYERLTDIIYPDNPENDVHYTYGKAGADYNRAGRIVLQEDATGAQEFFYGALGEVVKNVRTIVIPKFDDQTFVTEWTYDTWNRLTSMIYPDGEEVNYHYNVGGLLRSMDGKKKGYKFAYVNQLGYDKFEQRVFLEYGNGTKTTYSYEADRRRLKNIKATTASKRVFMDNVYSYDAVNNILSLKNQAPIPSSDKMGGSIEYAYDYDDLYRLTKAEGTYKGSNETQHYTLAMKYNTVGSILKKTQFHGRKGNGASDFQEQKKTTYDNDYTYGSEQPHAPLEIGRLKYRYDANGNQTGWTDKLSGQRRDILWDEENRIRAIADNGAEYHYVYDASGTRVLKAKSTGQSIYVNGKKKAGSGQMGNYTVHVNPYIVLRSGGYTKHYYIEGQRIVSKLGAGFDNKGQGPLKAGNDKVNYSEKQQALFSGIVRNQKFIDEDGNLLTAGKSGKTPPGQIVGSSDQSEPFRFFYHPDHLGSTSYITDANGEVYQHLEYFAFGETFVEEHSNKHRIPYKFNGKELDEETGLYYYGARYYDGRSSVWLSIDQMSDKYPGLSPYNYSFNNPLRYIDPNGADPDDVLRMAKSYLGTNYEWGGKNPDSRVIGMKDIYTNRNAQSIMTYVSVYLGDLTRADKWAKLNQAYKDLGLNDGNSFGIDCSGLAAKAFNSDPDKIMANLKLGSANDQMMQFEYAMFEGKGSLHNDFSSLGKGDLVFSLNKEGKAHHVMVATGNVRTNKDGGVTMFQTIEATHSGDKVRTQWRSVKGNYKIGHTFRTTDEGLMGPFREGTNEVQKTNFVQKNQNIIN